MFVLVKRASEGKSAKDAILEKCSNFDEKPDKLQKLTLGTLLGNIFKVLIVFWVNLKQFHRSKLKLKA